MYITKMIITNGNVDDGLPPLSYFMKPVRPSNILFNLMMLSKLEAKYHFATIWLLLGLQTRLVLQSLHSFA